MNGLRIMFENETQRRLIERDLLYLNQAFYSVEDLAESGVGRTVKLLLDQLDKGSSILSGHPHGEGASCSEVRDLCSQVYSRMRILADKALFGSARD